MYLVICNEPFHGNKVGYVVQSLTNAAECIRDCCQDFSFDLSEGEMDLAIDNILRSNCGHIYQDNCKIELEVSISEIEMGKKIDLE